MCITLQELLAAEIDRANITNTPIFIGARLNQSSRHWQFADNTPYNELFMIGRNFQAYGASDIMSVIVYPEWNVWENNEVHEVYGHPGRLEDGLRQPFACTRSAQKGILFARACAVFAERSDEANGTFSIRIEDTYRNIHFQDDFASAGPGLGTVRSDRPTPGLIRHACGEWHDVSAFRCGPTFGTSCEMAISHTGAGAHVTVYEYGLEMAVTAASVYSSMHYSGSWQIPLTNRESEYSNSSAGGWQKISDRVGFGFQTSPAYQLYGTHLAQDHAVRYCLEYTDNALDGQIQSNLRKVDSRGESMQANVGSSTRSYGQIVHEECSQWFHASQFSCDANVSETCQMDLRHSGTEWAPGSHDIEIYRGSIEVGVCITGYHLIGGYCIPNGCRQGCTQVDPSQSTDGTCSEALIQLPHSPTYCVGNTGDGCVYDCDSGYHVAHVHTCLFNGKFDGGACDINICEAKPIVNSSSTCTGVYMDICTPVCNFGYTLTQILVCTPEKEFVGGLCQPNLCTRHNQLADSRSDCTGGRTTDVCDYTCNPGWTVVGSHVCMPNGDHEGGFCQINRCTGGLTIEHSTTMCRGTTFDECTYECNTGYILHGAHICGTDGSFHGGLCVVDDPCVVNDSPMVYKDGTTRPFHGCSPDGLCIREERANLTYAGNHSVDRNPARNLWISHFTMSVSTPGTYRCECQIGNGPNPESPGFYGDGIDCASWSDCVRNETFQILSPNRTTNRECADVTECPAGYIDTLAPTYFRNRTCVACPPGSQQLSPGITHIFSPSTCSDCIGGDSDLDYNPATPCVECPDGTVQRETKFSGPCTFCAINQKDHDALPTTSCLDCAAGRRADMGATDCLAIECADSRFEHSLTLCSGTTGDICEYTCEHGYARVGSHTCNANGRSPGLFTGGACLALPCTEGFSPDDSSTHCSGDTAAICDFVCHPGFHAVPALAQLTCHEQGHWEGGTCEKNVCAELDIDSHSPTRCNGVLGDVCSLECRNGYYIAGSPLYQCGVHGTFEGNGYCTESPCYLRSRDLPPHTRDLGTCPEERGVEQVPVRAMVHGETCNLTCTGDGYAIDDSVGGDGWESAGEQPVCRNGQIITSFHCVYNGREKTDASKVANYLADQIGLSLTQIGLLSMLCCFSCCTLYYPVHILTRNMAEKKKLSKMDKDFFGVMDLVTVKEWVTELTLRFRMDPDMPKRFCKKLHKEKIYDIPELVLADFDPEELDLVYGVWIKSDRRKLMKALNHIKISQAAVSIEDQMHSMIDDVESNTVVAVLDAASLPPQIKAIRRMFKQSTEVDVRYEFRVLDKEGDGIIRVVDFEAGLRKLILPLSDHQIMELCKHFDFNNTSEVDLETFVQIFGDEVKSERRQEAAADKQRLIEEAQTKEETERQNALKAERIARKKLAKLRTLIEESEPPISDDARDKLLGSLKSRTELRFIERDTIITMGFSAAERKRVIQIQQKAEIYFMKKELAGDEQHSSDEDDGPDGSDVQLVQNPLASASGTEGPVKDSGSFETLTEEITNPLSTDATADATDVPPTESLSAAAAEDLEGKKDEGRKTAEDHFKKGDFESSVNVYESTIALDPDGTTLMSKKLKMGLKKTKGAIEKAEKLKLQQATDELEQQKKDQLQKGDALLAASSYAEAIEVYNAGLALDPDGTTITSKKLKNGLKKCTDRHEEIILAGTKKHRSAGDGAMKSFDFMLAIGEYRLGELLLLRTHSLLTEIHNCIAHCFCSCRT